MPSIHLRGLCYAHDTATPVLGDVDLDLTPEPHGSWVGVVGANGAGKTTLLVIVAGLLAPTGGRLDVHADVPPILVRQPVDVPDDGVLDLANRWDGPAMQLRGRLELDEASLLVDPEEGWRRLSPGQRKRWQLAAALASDPEVLLLDEPTNHLDDDARGVLVGALRQHRGLGLVVSHDRALLDDLTDPDPAGARRDGRAPRGSLLGGGGALAIRGGEAPRATCPSPPRRPARTSDPRRRPSGPTQRRSAHAPQPAARRCRPARRPRGRPKVRPAQGRGGARCPGGADATPGRRRGARLTGDRGPARPPWVGVAHPRGDGTPGARRDPG